MGFISRSVCAILGAVFLLGGCSTVKVDTYAIRDPRIQEVELDSIEDLRRQQIVLTALSALGKPYRWGGTKPEEGFDCSGLVYFAYVQNGVDESDLPRTAAQLAKEGEPIKRSELKPGDLVFFNTLGKRYSHVGLYLGEGRFVNAPSSGKNVRIDSLDNPYYKKRYTGARRLDVI